MSSAKWQSFGSGLILLNSQLNNRYVNVWFTSIKNTTISIYWYLYLDFFSNWNLSVICFIQIHLIQSAHASQLTTTLFTWAKLYGFSMWFGIPKCSPTPMLGFKDSYSECMQFLVKIIVPFSLYEDFFVYCFVTGISGKGAHFASTMPLIPCPSRRKGVTNIHWRWLVNSLNSVKYQNASLYYV